MAMLKSNGWENSVGSYVQEKDSQNGEHFNHYLTCQSQAVTPSYSDYKPHMGSLKAQK